VLAAQRSWDEAERELAALALAAPRRPEVPFAAAFVALARGRADEAVRLARAALALRVRYPEARLVLAEGLARLARDQEARREFERVPAHDPAGAAAL